jgi:hypothetical protein
MKTIAPAGHLDMEAVTVRLPGWKCAWKHIFHGQALESKSSQERKGAMHRTQQACVSVGEAITSAIELNNMCSSSCTQAWNRLYRGTAVQAIHVGAGGYLFMAFLEAFSRL